MKNTFNIEELARFSLQQTGDYCTGTMLAQYAALHPQSSDNEIITVASIIEEFVNDAI